MENPKKALWKTRKKRSKKTPKKPFQKKPKTLSQPSPSLLHINIHPLHPPFRRNNNRNLDALIFDDPSRIFGTFSLIIQNVNLGGESIKDSPRDSEQNRPIFASWRPFFDKFADRDSGDFWGFWVASTGQAGSGLVVGPPAWNPGSKVRFLRDPS